MSDSLVIPQASRYAESNLVWADHNNHTKLTFSSQVRMQALFCDENDGPNGNLEASTDSEERDQTVMKKLCGIKLIMAL